LSDAIAGTFAANGIVAALFHRERTGEGQAIDVAMSDCLFSLIFDEPIDCYERLDLAPRQGNRIMRFSPFNIFRTTDGWVAIGAATHTEWLALLDAMGRADLKDDPGMMDIGWRIVNNAKVDEAVTRWTERMTKDAVVAALSRASVACSPVRSTADVMEWEQLLAREMIVRLVNPLTGAASVASAPGFPIKFSRTPASYDVPAPIPGAHSDEIFARMANLSAADMNRLKAEGVI